jgi:hypothetical protein
VELDPKSYLDQRTHKRRVRKTPPFYRRRRFKDGLVIFLCLLVFGSLVVVLALPKLWTAPSDGPIITEETARILP